MRRVVCAGALALALAGGATFAAADVNDVYSVTAKATSGGTKAKPVGVAASLEMSLKPGGGHKRGGVPKTLAWQWDGVVDNAAQFPRCTPAQIDAAQSDSVCAKGSLIATGTINALLGPDSDPDQGAACQKKVNIYNGGPGAETYFVYGDPSLCAGVSYLAPLKLVVTKSSKGRSVLFRFPDNFTHPLPGVSGGFLGFGVSYKKSFVTKGGHKVPYLVSTGCKGKRELHFTVAREDGPTQHPTAVAGNC